MLNWKPESGEEYEDVQTRYLYEHSLTWLPEKLRLRRLWRGSRDSSRTPVQWTGGENAGFSTVKPWFTVNENYRAINCTAEEADAQSILNFYREAIRLRKALPVVRDGVYREHQRASGRLYVYTRENAKQRLLVVCSFTEKPVRFRAPKGYDLTAGKPVLQNYLDAPCAPDGFTTRPYEARVYLFE